jgi:hypothetical protein
MPIEEYRRDGSYERKCQMGRYLPAATYPPAAGIARGAMFPTSLRNPI